LHTARATTESDDAKLARSVRFAISVARDSGEATFITDEKGAGQVAIIPAASYHDPGECCCGNCPWDGDHRNRVPSS
jgi:hypothetical protein